MEVKPTGCNCVRGLCISVEGLVVEHTPDGAIGVGGAGGNGASLGGGIKLEVKESVSVGGKNSQ